MVKKSSLSGLSSREAKRQLAIIGPNALEQKKPNYLLHFLRMLIAPISLMLISAAVLSLIIGKTFDFYFILFLYSINFGVSIWHEQKADKAIEKLQSHLRVHVETRRDNNWKTIESRQLVPGDIIRLHIGNLIPADITIVEESNLTINESVLTGESLPIQKQADDKGYSGSFLTTGSLTGRVETTGNNTRFGKTIVSIDTRPKKSLMEQDILLISQFLSLLSVVCVITLSAILLLQPNPVNLLELITLDISILIAGIPIALPTVMTLITSIGVLELSKEKVVVRRLSSLEDLANVNLFLTDKTGTLTKNEISVANTISYGNFKHDDVVRLAAIGASQYPADPLNRAVLTKAKVLSLGAYTVVSFVPADSERKRSTCVIKESGKETTITIGAAQIVAPLCTLSTAEKKIINADVAKAGKAGYRVLAIAQHTRSRSEKNSTLVGLLLFSDTIRPESADTIRFMGEHGIMVKMLTGDNRSVSSTVANELGLAGPMIYRQKFKNHPVSYWERHLLEIAGFSEILPIDKYMMTQQMRKNYTVAVTGDGINDLPAIKASAVGIAVSNAVDALKASADIILLGNGIEVIKTAIIEARKIFTRLFNYTIYRLSESFRVIITITVLGFIYHDYPLTPVQLILLALLNDIPIVTLAFDRVKLGMRPSTVQVRKRFVLSTIFGLVGVMNSLLFFWLGISWLHLDWDQLQTLFFLKLTVSGHMLIYVAHTQERWFKFLPSYQVILATTLTQLVATILAVGGIFTSPVSLGLIAFVWGWSFFWMQISELLKWIHQKFSHL